MESFPTKTLNVNPKLPETPDGGSGRRPHPLMPGAVKPQVIVPADPAVVKRVLQQGDPNARVDDWSFQPQTESSTSPQSNPGVKQTRAEETPTEDIRETAIPDASPGRNIAAIPTGGYLTTSEKNADYFGVDLPSRFAFYPFKNLSVALIRGRQQAKFNRAAQEQSSRYMMEGVTSLLGDGVSVSNLTSGDFYWLLYWLLLSSYTARFRTTTIVCQDEDHLAKVERKVAYADSVKRIGTDAANAELIGKKVESPEDQELLNAALQDMAGEDTLKSTITYDRPTIKEMQLDQKALQALDLSSLQGIELGAYLVRDMLDWEDNYEANATAEDYFTYDLAVYLKNGTLEERAEVVRDMSTIQINALTAYREVAGAHGVQASLKCICKECGAENEVNISISAHDFL